MCSTYRHAFTARRHCEGQWLYQWGCARSRGSATARCCTCLATSAAGTWSDRAPVWQSAACVYIRNRMSEFRAAEPVTKSHASRRRECSSEIEHEPTHWQIESLQGPWHSDPISERQLRLVS